MKGESGQSRYWVVIPAAGSGKRMGENIPKPYLTLGDSPVIEHSVSIFTAHPRISQVVVVLAADDARWSQLAIAQSNQILTTVGGDTRAHSVMQGLERLKNVASSNDWVLVHDAARPCLTRSALDRLIQTLQDHPIGGLLAVPVADTLKKVTADNIVRETVAREQLWCAQTPQMFRFEILYSAIKKALAENVSITDEASAVEFIGEHPLVVKGDSRNIKITRPEDLVMAENYV